MLRKKPGKTSGRMRSFLRLIRGGKPRPETPHANMLEQHAKEVTELNVWRRELSIEPNSRIDRAVAVLIDLAQKRSGKWETYARGKLDLLKMENRQNPDLVPVKICIMAEAERKEMLSSRLKSAKNSDERGMLRKKLEESSQILERLKRDLREGGTSSLVWYTDSEVPVWFKAANPAQPAFQRFIGIRE